MGTSKGESVFCDNADCFTWFTADGATRTGDVVIAPNGIAYDARTTQAMQKRGKHRVEGFRSFADGSPPVVA